MRALLAFSLAFAMPPSKGHAAPGTSGGDILNFATGVRAIGMGEAYTAQADDVSSLYWNPAGIGLLNQGQASFMYNQAYQGLSFQNAAMAVPFDYGGIGASLSYLSYGTINGYDVKGNPASEVNAYSGVGTLGGAYYGGPISIGANAKVVQGKLADTSATGLAADVGAIYTIQHEMNGGTIRLGTSIRNMGTGLRYISQTDPFPLEWRIGAAAVQMMDKKLNFSVDYGQQKDVRGAVYAGVEYLPIPILALRTGYAGTYAEGSGLRAGIGLRIKDFSFDYAYAPYGDLGLSHRYELSFRFGAIEPRLTPEERVLYRRAKLAMAQGNYGEATMLMDSLVSMEPHYRPFRRTLVMAMRDYEWQEGAESAMAVLKPSGRGNYDDAIDIKELESLLNLSESDVRTADTGSTESPAETNTLAPMIGPNEVQR